MFANWTFGRRLALAFAVTGLAIVVIAVSGYESSRTMVDNNDLVMHTQ